MDVQPGCYGGNLLAAWEYAKHRPIANWIAPTCLERDFRHCASYFGHEFEVGTYPAHTLEQWQEQATHDVSFRIRRERDNARYGSHYSSGTRLNMGGEVCMDWRIDVSNTIQGNEPIIRRYERVQPDQDGSNLRAALDEGPVAIAFEADNDEYRRYASGIYPSSNSICRAD